MRTVLFLCVLLATLAQAHDFSDISKPTVTLLDDGHYRFVHTTHHTFINPDGNQTYFHLDATAEIHKQWNFVDLNDYAGAGGIAVAKICHEAKVASSIISVVTKNATAKASLLTKLQKPHTIVKFTGLRCGGQGVFSHFDSVIPTPTNALQVKLQLRQAQLHDVFRHASVKMRTNHILMNAFSPEESAALLAQQREIQKVGPAPSSASRKMQSQWTWAGGWDSVKNGFSSAYDHVTHTAEAVADDLADIAKEVVNDVYDEAKDLLDKAEDSIRFVTQLAQGDISTGQKSWNLAKTSYGSSSLMWNPYISAPSSGIRYKSYVGFKLDVVFSLEIKSYSVKSFSAVVEAQSQAAVAVAAGYKTKGSKTFQLCDIRLSSINFMIGVVPVHIQPYIPVSFKLDYSFTASAHFGATATGSIKSGYKYNYGYYSPINSHSFRWGKKHQLTKQVNAQATASLIPSLVLDIDFLGGPIGSISLSATMALAKKSSGSYYLQFNANLAPSISAVFKVEVGRHTILGPKTIGPHTFDGTSFNLGRVTLWSWSSRHLAAQEADSSNAVATTTNELLPGTTWRGGAIASGSCAYDQQVTFQLIAANNSQLAMMAVISISGTNPETQQNAVSTAVVPYTLSPNTDGSYAAMPGKLDSPNMLLSTTAAWLQTAAPGFTAKLSQAGDLVLSDQIGGVQLCTGAMTLSPGVFSSTEEVLAAAAGSAPADNSGGSVTTHQTIGIVIGGCVGVVLIAIAVGAVVSSRKKRSAATSGDAAAKAEQEVPLELRKEGDTDLI